MLPEHNRPLANYGLVLAYLWAATWIIGPLAASWPHVFLGFMVCLPGAAALVIVHTLREFPASLGVLLLVIGIVVAILADARVVVLALGTIPPAFAGILLIGSRFLTAYRVRR